MKIVNCSQHGAEVRLSRANLLTLLHKLDDPRSSRTIIKRGKDNRTLMVTAEEDEQHYGGEKRGEMTPDTEAFIAQHARRTVTAEEVSA